MLPSQRINNNNDSIIANIIDRINCNNINIIDSNDNKTSSVDAIVVLIELTGGNTNTEIGVAIIQHRQHCYNNKEMTSNVDDSDCTLVIQINIDLHCYSSSLQLSSSRRINNNSFVRNHDNIVVTIINNMNCNDNKNIDYCIVVTINMLLSSRRIGRNNSVVGIVIILFSSRRISNKNIDFYYCYELFPSLSSARWNIGNLFGYCCTFSSNSNASSSASSFIHKVFAQYSYG